MIPSSYTKQPWDSRKLCIDFTDSLAPGDTVSSIDSISAWESTVDRTSSIIDGGTLVGNNVYFSVNAGSDGVTYDIRIRVISTNGDQIEEDLSLVVREET